jgi:16S rRNA (guanine527-N7)-methyltransferase
MATQENIVWLQTVCAKNGLPLDEQMLSRYAELVTRLLEWNKKINLISRRDEEGIWSSHILHSLSILFKLRIPQGLSILDLGTGGGLPGLPLKIARPDLQLTLLDSTQKKINVVNEIASSLKLEHVTSVWGRAEVLGRQPEHAAKFDLVVARAVAPLKDLIVWSLPFLKREKSNTAIEEGDERMLVAGPALIALKGGDLMGEFARIKHLSAVTNTESIALTLHGSQQLEEGEKKIVVVSLNPEQSKRTDKR